MNQASINRLAKVHPILATRVRALIDGLAAKGYPFEVVQGLRTYAEQDALYAQGRTKPGKIVTRAKGGQSNHNFGMACDIAPVRNGTIDWNWRQAFLAINHEAEKAGLLWGGDWSKFVDLPHVELPGPSIKESQILFKKGGLEAVWKEAKASPIPVKVEAPPAVISQSDADKGVTTSDKPADETEGTPPPAPAVEVKASAPSWWSKVTAISMPALPAGVGAGIWGFASGIPPWGWAVIGGIIMIGMILGAWLYNESMKRAAQRTQTVLNAAADPNKNNLRLV